MADPIEALFDEPYHEYTRPYGWQIGRKRYASVAFLAQQGIEEGMSLDEIADELGKSPAQVAQALKTAGIACPNWERECAFRRGLFGPLFRATDAQAAEVCGVSVGAIAGWRARNGIPANPARKSGGA